MSAKSYTGEYIVKPDFEQLDEDTEKNTWDKVCARIIEHFNFKKNNVPVLDVDTILTISVKKYWKESDFRYSNRYKDITGVKEQLRFLGGDRVIGVPIWERKPKSYVRYNAKGDKGYMSLNDKIQQEINFYRVVTALTA